MASSLPGEIPLWWGPYAFPMLPAALPKSSNSAGFSNMWQNPFFPATCSQLSLPRYQRLFQRFTWAAGPGFLWLSCSLCHISYGLSFLLKQQPSFVLSKSLLEHTVVWGPYTQYHLQEVCHVNSHGQVWLHLCVWTRHFSTTFTPGNGIVSTKIPLTKSHCFCWRHSLMVEIHSTPLGSKKYWEMAI